jgi:acyl-coenzyme A synthetase/AMP-(fatty) acid ligase
MDWLIDRIREYDSREAIVSNNEITTYRDIFDTYVQYSNWILEKEIPPGGVIALEGNYSDKTISFLLAFAANGNIIVPLSDDSKPLHDDFLQTSEAEYVINEVEGTEPKLQKTNMRAGHVLYRELKERNSPGIVLFSSGSTGKNKGIVHDYNKLLLRHQKHRKPYRMLIFLKIDHIGGINSLLYSLANGGTIIVPSSRNPESICSSIEKWKVELLPTSPTFLNLMIISSAYKGYDLSSLTLITYGTEPMPQSTLTNLSKVFKNVTFQQTYGMSEIGILRSKSETNNSLWFKIGGEEFQVKVVDNRLYVKSDSAMIGYLNSEDPFDDEGFIDTGDIVERKGEWIKILGRESEIINVGGEKVYPAEVESVILDMDNVKDVAVLGQPHAIMGQIVSAKIELEVDEPAKDFKIRMRKFCKEKLQHYKIPTKIYFVDSKIYNERYKRIRR